jgi:hypothetical protein
MLRPIYSRCRRLTAAGTVSAAYVEIPMVSFEAH